MEKIWISVCLLSLGMICCQKSGQNSAELPADFNADQLLLYAGELNRMVDKAEIADIADISGDKIKVYEENFDESVSSYMILYSWKDGGSFSVTTSEGLRNIDTYASIGVGHVERISTAEFENKYRQKTSEIVKSEIKAITGNESIDPDVAIWEVKELVKKVKFQSFEKLDNVGTAAYWETPVNVLHVHAKEVAFSISANLDEDSNVNKEKAIALARKIFQKQKH